ncbi:hypothetical protein MTO96_020521 [Rhipicephalus appendiculatus]
MVITLRVKFIWRQHFDQLLADTDLPLVTLMASERHFTERFVGVLQSQTLEELVPLESCPPAALSAITDIVKTTRPT